MVELQFLTQKKKALFQEASRFSRLSKELVEKHALANFPHGHS